MKEFIEEMAGIWEGLGDRLDKYGGQGGVYRAVARDLRENFTIWQEEELTLTQAAKETGYSYSALYRQVADGKLPAFEDDGYIRVKRKHLPRRPTNEQTLAV